MRCFFDPNLRWSLCRYVLYGGETLPHFFFARDIPIASITLLGRSIEHTAQYRRVQRILSSYPDPPNAAKLEGRDTDRVFTLVQTRMTGSDDFVVLVERIGVGRYALIDGRLVRLFCFLLERKLWTPL